MTRPQKRTVSTPDPLEGLMPVPRSAFLKDFVISDEAPITNIDHQRRVERELKPWESPPFPTAPQHAPPGVSQLPAPGKVKTAGIACLAMLSGEPYAAVEQIASLVLDRTLPLKGMWQREIVEVGEVLGLVLQKRYRTLRLSEDVGVLNIQGLGESAQTGWDYYVVLYQGLLFDPDRRVYTPEDYLRCVENAEFGNLLRLEGRTCPTSM